MRLIINGIDADVFNIEDVTPKIFKKTFDWNTASKKADFTLDLRLPRTSKNRGIFQHIEDLQTVGGFFSLQNYKCQIENNGAILISGSLIVNKVNPDSYSCDLVGDNLSWLTILGDKSLREIESIDTYYYMGSKVSWIGDGSGVNYTDLVCTGLGITSSDLVSIYDIFNDSVTKDYPNTFALTNYGGYYVPPQNNNRPPWNLVRGTTNDNECPPNWASSYPGQPLPNGGYKLWFSEQFALSLLQFYPMVYVIRIVEAIFKESGRNITGDIFSILENIVQTYSNENDILEGLNWGLLGKVYAATNDIVGDYIVSSANSIGGQTFIFSKSTVPNPTPPNFFAAVGVDVQNVLYNIWNNSEQVILTGTRTMQFCKPVMWGYNEYDISLTQTSADTIVNGYGGEELFNPLLDATWGQCTRLNTQGDRWADLSHKTYNAPATGNYKFRYKFDNLRIRNNRVDNIDIGTYRGEAFTPYAPDFSSAYNNNVELIFMLVKNRGANTGEGLIDNLSTSANLKEQINYGENVVSYLHFDNTNGAPTAGEINFDYTIISEPVAITRSGMWYDNNNFEFEWDVELERNDKVEFMYAWRYYARNASNDGTNRWITDGQVHVATVEYAECEITPQFDNKFNVCKTLPDIKAIDYIKQIADTFNLIISDTNNTIRLTSFDNYYQTGVESIDWSNKTTTDNCSLSPLSDIRELRLTQAKDEKDRFSVEYIDSKANNSRYFSTLKNIDSLTTITHFERTQIQGSSAADTALGDYLVPVMSTADSYSTRNEDRLNNPNSLSFVPRLLRFNGVDLRGTSNPVYLGEGTRSDSSTNFFPRHLFSSVNLTGRYNRYFEQIVRATRVEVNVLLSDTDVANLQYNIPVKIGQHLFFVEEIKGYTPLIPLTKVVLVKLS